MGVAQTGTYLVLVKRKEQAMKAFFGLAFMIFSMSYVYVGCSDVRFYNRPLADCDNIDGSFDIESCKTGKSGKSTVVFNVKSGAVDIVFMVDNSGSMHVEQQEIADKIADPTMNPNFFDHISNLDYRIAMVTSDTQQNPSGDFLTYPNSEKWIYREIHPNGSVSQTPNIVDEFRDTVQRPESLTCFTSNYKNCPSSDERGILSLSNTVKNPAQRSFFRNGAHLAFVIISDENERSSGGSIAGHPALVSGLDFPENLVDDVENYLGASKTISAHSIIIQPDHIDPVTNNFVAQDSACKAQQDNQGQFLSGFYGTIYSDLSLPTSSNGLLNRGGLVTGSTGSICSNDYGQLLSNIADVVAQNTKKFVKLPCTPQPGGVKVEYIPDPGGPKNPTWGGNNILTLDPVPDPSVGTQVQVTVQCK